MRPATKFLKKRIRKTEDFIADENNKNYQLTAGEALSGTKWVLNFYEAQDKYNVNNVWLSFIPGVTQINGVADGEAELNNVYDVSILRLEFETDGKPFNLGVIDNKQTGNTQFNGHNGGGLPLWAIITLILLAVLILLFVLYSLIVRITAPRERRERREQKRPKSKKRKPEQTLGTSGNAKNKKPVAQSRQSRRSRRSRAEQRKENKK